MIEGVINLGIQSNREMIELTLSNDRTVAKKVFYPEDIDVMIRRLEMAKADALNFRTERQRKRDEFQRLMLSASYHARIGQKISAVKLVREAWALLDPEGKPMDLWAAKTIVESFG